MIYPHQVILKPENGTDQTIWVKCAALLDPTMQMPH